MKEIESAREVLSLTRDTRCRAKSSGFVPTMGYLHAGHGKLIETARDENHLVVVSIYVNPAQFGPNEDLDRYPRDLEHDREMCLTAGVDALFVPSDETMYPGGYLNQTVWVDPGTLASQLCGAARPGHFRGVATVVAKLFNLAQPDRAYFGQKDAQQAIIVRKMTEDLAMPVEIRVVDTVREPDGLALSSRNVYLSSEERHEATALYRALQLARAEFESGKHEVEYLVDTARHCVKRGAPNGKVEYVSLVDLKTLQPIHGQVNGESLLALAVHFGRTRLIDNVTLTS